ncbi:discoidin domain-containing protein [Cellvibrio sp. PSBB023]|uniref:discoidin domain-containing protein n=1 Tax=Cellvibrio sp. PSBB023 TaxID=1945512 RepID=UPI00098E9605|nr:discoidin domain-containing protein [Cellvibrio sp. PSBB023]AQT61291.1 hypothetical protein B0D95_15135 [Cellvibrio sp. PSBB023]
MNNIFFKKIVFFLLAIIASKAFSCNVEINLANHMLKTSNSAAGSPSSFLIDGNITTSWSSGLYAQQWIQIDLGTVQPVCKVQLIVSQYPSGNTTQTILIGNTEQTLQVLKTYQQYTTNGQVLSYPIESNTRFIRIRTDASPSWISWYEVNVFSHKAALVRNNPNIKHFGYFMDGGSTDVTESNPSGQRDQLYNKTSEIADHSNISWTNIWRAQQKINELIALGKANEIKLIIDLSDLFYIHGPNGIEQNAQYNQNWDSYAHNFFNNYSQYIAAVTLMDEPDLKPNIISGFTERINFVKSKINPSIAVFTNYSYEAFSNNIWPGFESSDWVGFNCYPSRNYPATNPQWNQYSLCHPIVPSLSTSIHEYVKKLVDKTSAHQKIAIFPESAYFLAPDATASRNRSLQITVQEKKNLNAIYDNFILIADNEPKVIGAFNFIYQSLSVPGEKWIGLEWLDDLNENLNLKEKVRNNGLCITSVNNCPVKRLRPISAKSISGNAGNAFDDDINTLWNSGNSASTNSPQSIYFGFPYGVNISKVKLIPSHTPICQYTEVQIWGGPNETGLHKMAVISKSTCDLEEIVLDKFWQNGNIKHMEVRTISSQSWVAWREIEIYN